MRNATPMMTTTEMKTITTTYQRCDNDDIMMSNLKKGETKTNFECLIHGDKNAA